MRRAATAFVVAVLASGCGNGDGESDGIFEEESFPFTFEYPDGWTESDEVTINQSLGSEAEAVAGIGLDRSNALVIERFTLNFPVHEANLDRVKAEFDVLVEEIDPQRSFKETQVAGLPALRADDLDIRSIEDGKSTIVVVFEGDQEYFLNCQSTPSKRSDVEQACQLAIETFTLK